MHYPESPKVNRGSANIFIIAKGSSEKKRLGNTAV